MIYPKFPRRTLALILFCLVITLGAVGILFLVYFFNESSGLLMESSFKTVYSDQKQNQQYRQNIIGKGEHNFDQKTANKHIKYIGESLNQAKVDNRSSILQTSDEDISILSPSSLHGLETHHGKQAFLLTKTDNSKGSKDSITNSDTIYIDEFDKPTYNSKSKSEISNIDYFDTILVDHKNEKENIPKLNSLKLQGAASMRSIMYHQNLFPEHLSNNLNENERKLRINSKRPDNGSRWNKTKLLRYSKVTQNASDDDDLNDLEIGTIGSGSGDFVDDTEINEIFLNHINTKTVKKENNFSKSQKKNNFKNSRVRKKYQHFFFNDDNEFISSPPTLTTLSSGDDRSINNWASQRSFKKLSLYPTSSSPTTEQIYSSSIKTSQSFSESTNRKWSAPALIPDQQKSIVNNSNSYSANSPNSPSNNNLQFQMDLGELGSTSTARVIESSVNNLREIGTSENNGAWIETRTRRIMGNVKKSEERSRQLLLCEEAGGGELCRMLFKGHIND